MKNDIVKNLKFVSVAISIAFVAGGVVYGKDLGGLDSIRLASLDSKELQNLNSIESKKQNIDASHSLSMTNATIDEITQNLDFTNAKIDSIKVASVDSNKLQNLDSKNIESDLQVSPPSPPAKGGGIGLLSAKGGVKTDLSAKGVIVVESSANMETTSLRDSTNTQNLDSINAKIDSNKLQNLDSNKIDASHSLSMTNATSDEITQNLDSKELQNLTGTSYTLKVTNGDTDSIKLASLDSNKLQNLDSIKVGSLDSKELQNLDAINANLDSKNIESDLQVSPPNPPAKGGATAILDSKNTNLDSINAKIDSNKLQNLDAKDIDASHSLSMTGYDLDASQRLSMTNATSDEITQNLDSINAKIDSNKIENLDSNKIDASHSLSMTSSTKDSISTQNLDTIILAENKSNEFDIQDSGYSGYYYGDSSDKKKFFTFDGQLSSFVKAGFNNAKIDRARGVYPTDSFATIFGQFNTHYDFLAFIDNSYLTRFKVALGASAGGLILDSTLRDGAAFANTGLSGGSGANNNYFGGWNGYFFELNADGYPYKHNRNFIVQDAYIDIETKIGDGLIYGNDLLFNFKGGRYASGNEYYSGYNQGFSASLRFAYGDVEENEDNEAKLWWISSYGRALAYSEWFLDFYAVKSTNVNGKSVNYGIHGVGFDYKHGGIGKSASGNPAGYTLLVRPFAYFYPGLYEAAGLKGVLEYQLGNGFGYKATLQGYFLHVHDASAAHGNGAGGRRYDSIIDGEAGNINAIFQVFMYNYNARVGVYKNFGSANSHFGTYGNPMGFDFWTAGVYDIGASISDVINRDAVSGYLSGGGSYNLKYGTLSWDILARLTRSPRSDEESLALTISHAFKNNIALSVKLEWFRDTTKAGYNPGATLPGSTALTATRTDDRSHAFVMFDYMF